MKESGDQPKPYMTVEQYLHYEASSDERHEYEDGQIYAIEGASLKHALITANLFGILRDRLQGTSCRAYSKDLQFQAGLRWAYPDLVVSCGKQEWIHETPT